MLAGAGCDRIVCSGALDVTATAAATAPWKHSAARRRPAPAPGVEEMPFIVLSVLLSETMSLEECAAGSTWVPSRRGMWKAEGASQSSLASLS